MNLTLLIWLDYFPPYICTLHIDLPNILCMCITIGVGSAGATPKHMVHNNNSSGSMGNFSPKLMPAMSPSSNGAISKTTTTSSPSVMVYDNIHMNNSGVSSPLKYQNYQQSQYQQKAALAQLRIADSTGNYDNIDNYAGLFENLDTAVASLNNCDIKSSPSPKSDTTMSSLPSDNTDNSSSKSAGLNRSLVENGHGQKDTLNWSSSGETSSEHSLNQSEVSTGPANWEIILFCFCGRLCFASIRNLGLLHLL